MSRFAFGRMAFCLSAIAMTALTVRPASAQTVSFDQIDWVGMASGTADSAWGQVNLDFTGQSSTHYFNLEVNGNWVVQNMGVSSLYGTGVNQSTRTFFDLGVTPGVDVSSLNYVFSFSPTVQLAPIGGVGTNVGVNNLSYQIGGEGGVDLGSPAAVGVKGGAGGATVTASATMPNINDFDNQVQGPNQCAPGAISNSLKYLQATGSLDPLLDTDISDIATIIGTDANGTPANWPTLKGNFFAGTLDTSVLGPGDIAGLIAAVNAGKDVELDLQGHVAVIAGVRQFSDGRIEFDIFDDNQTDNVKDLIRTVELKDGKVDGMGIDGYVVESAVVVPEASSVVLMGLAPLALVGFGIRRRREIA